MRKAFISRGQKLVNLANKPDCNSGIISKKKNEEESKLKPNLKSKDMLNSGEELKDDLLEGISIGRPPNYELLDYPPEGTSIGILPNSELPDNPPQCFSIGEELKDDLLEGISTGRPPNYELLNYRPEGTSIGILPNSELPDNPPQCFSIGEGLKDNPAECSSIGRPSGDVSQDDPAECSSIGGPPTLPHSKINEHQICDDSDSDSQSKKSSLVCSGDDSPLYVPNLDDLSSSSSSSDDLDMNEEISFDQTGIINNSDEVQNPELIVREITNEGSQIGKNKKRKTFLLHERVSKKRKCDPNTWKRKASALARQRGAEYVSYKNIKVPEKKPNDGVLCREKCRLKCSSRFNLQDRVKFLEEFYKLDVNAKNALLFKSITKKAVSRERKDAKKHKTATFIYTVNKQGKAEQVCKEALCSLYQVGRKKIDILKSRVQSGVSAPPPDCRGKHMNRPHRMDDCTKQHIVEHINRFPVEESHYSRNKNPHKKYLSPLLNLSKMYELYIEECNQANLQDKFKIKKSSYNKVFVTEFNLSFGSPRSDTCATCDAGEDNQEHKENVKSAFEAMRCDRNRAKSDKNIVFLTIDLQQTMPLPKLSTSNAFYLRQMWFYNFGIHIIDNSSERACFCTWTEDIANRGSSEIYSSLLRYIEVDESITDKKHLIIWSDSCAGQNKNFTMICLYQYLVLKGYFDCIDHKFPEVGHSYLDSDRDFGRIEKKLRKHEVIYVPEKYREIISSASKINQVIDMTNHFKKLEELPEKLHILNRKKDSLNKKIRFRDGIKWVRVNKFGSYLYKESYDEATPFIEVNLLRKKNSVPPAAEDIHIQRIREKYGTISEEKRRNLQEQIKFVRPEYRYFYEEIIENFQ